MKTILAVPLVLVAACASVPISAPVRVVVDAKSPMRGVDADRMADVAKHYFAKYSGPSRTVAITLSGFEDVRYEILDGLNAVLETGSVPIVDKLDSLAVYNLTGRFLADRLCNLNRAQIVITAYDSMWDSEADFLRSIAFERVPDTGPLTVEVTMSEVRVNGGRSGNPPPANFSASPFNAPPLMDPPSGNPPPPNYYVPYSTSTLPGDSRLAVDYIIRDASGKPQDRGGMRMVAAANHEKKYQELVERIAKRVAELRSQ